VRSGQQFESARRLFRFGLSKANYDVRSELVHEGNPSDDIVVLRTLVDELGKLVAALLLTSAGRSDVWRIYDLLDPPVSELYLPRNGYTFAETSCHSEEARVHEKLGDSVVRGHGDGRDRLAAARDRGRVSPVVKADTGNSADVADHR
jgi:hypothetical protein